MKYVLLAFILQCFNVQAQKVNYLKTSFTNAEMMNFSILAGKEKILLFKSNAVDSCFWLDCTTNEVKQINTTGCGKNLVSREAIFYNGNFILLDRCVELDKVIFNFYSINKEGNIEKFEDFKTLPLKPLNHFSLSCSADKRFSYQFEIITCEYSAIMRGVLTDHKQKMARLIELPFNIDTLLTEYAEPFIDNSGTIHLFTFDKKSNYKLNTTLNHFQTNVNGTIPGKQSTTFRKKKICKSFVEEKKGQVTFTCLTVDPNNEYHLKEVKTVPKMVVNDIDIIQSQQVEIKKSSTATLYYDGQHIKCLLNKLLDKNKIQQVDRHVLNIYSVLENERFISVRYDSFIGNFIQSGFNKVMGQLFNTYQLIPTLNVFVSHAMKNNHAAISIYDIATGKQQLFELEKNTITDLSCLVIINKDLYFPYVSENDKQAGFARIHLDAVNN